MSGGYAGLHKRRSRSMLKLARQLLCESEYDLAVLNTEYAAQLFAKAIFHRVSGEEVRGHSLRVSLGLLASTLEGEGFREEAEMLIAYVRSNRRVVAELEEGYVRSVYGVYSYSK